VLNIAAHVKTTTLKVVN